MRSRSFQSHTEHKQFIPSSAPLPDPMPLLRQTTHRFLSDRTNPILPTVRTFRRILHVPARPLFRPVNLHRARHRPRLLSVLQRPLLLRPFDHPQIVNALILPRGWLSSHHAGNHPCGPDQQHHTSNTASQPEPQPSSFHGLQFFSGRKFGCWLCRHYSFIGKHRLHTKVSSIGLLNPQRLPTPSGRNVGGRASMTKGRYSALSAEKICARGEGPESIGRVKVLSPACVFHSGGLERDQWAGRWL